MLRLHVHVIAVRLPAPGTDTSQAAADLLPWADPYIAALLRRLAEDDVGEPVDDLLAGLDDDLVDPLAQDAFVPPDEEPLTVLRPVVGGYPLLDAPPRAEHMTPIGWKETPDEPLRRPR